MAFGGIPQDDEGGWVKFIVFEDEAKNLDKFLSSHNPSDPSWNKCVIFRILLFLFKSCAQICGYFFHANV